MGEDENCGVLPQMPPFGPTWPGSDVRPPRPAAKRVKHYYPGTKESHALG
jgi:hypothetical protein